MPLGPRFRGWVVLWSSAILLGNLEALSSNTQRCNVSKSLTFALQKCTTPNQVLRDVGSQLSPATELSVSGLVLVRLSKQVLTLQNEYLHPTAPRQITENARPKKTDNMASWQRHVEQQIFDLDSRKILHNIIQHFAEAAFTPPISSLSVSTLESMVDGTKSLALLARLMPEIVTLECCYPLLEFWESVDSTISLEPHQLSGLNWAYACLNHVHGGERSHSGISRQEDSNPQSTTISQLQLPKNQRQAYLDLNLPFRIVPGRLDHVQDLTVANLVAEVPFQIDAIRTTSTQQVVKERRETAWQGDEGVSPFAYSGKAMIRHPWSPSVRRIRDALVEETRCSNQDQCFPASFYYDGCLLNHYPDGGSAMRYHSDPDQGLLWDFNTVVVSVGASRRVAFRAAEHPQPTTNGAPTMHSQTIPYKGTAEQPHAFVVMHGDVMEMIGDCQERFQHVVKPADNKREQAARASLVFKRTLPTV
jgi:alkylated DNA repair dioxygenase AlkB